MIKTQTHFQKTFKNAQGIAIQRPLNIGSDQDVPRVHLFVRHLIEHMACVFENIAFAVGQEKVSLESNVGKEAMDKDVSMNLLSLGKRVGRSAASQ